MMTAAQIRLLQNPILTNLLLGMGQGNMIAERLFPRLPHALSSVSLAKLGDERFKRYNLRRAPGAATKRVDIKYEGVTYTVAQYAVEVPMPRELIREADESKRLNVGAHLDVSKIAMATASHILALDYEIEAATLATTTGTYNGNVLALAGGTKWSAATGTPVAADKQRREFMRWIILRTLDMSRPAPATLRSMTLVVQAEFQDATDLEVRRHLDYLEERDLIQVTTDPMGQVRAELKRYGIDIVEYTVESGTIMLSRTVHTISATSMPPSSAPSSSAHNLSKLAALSMAVTFSAASAPPGMSACSGSTVHALPISARRRFCRPSNTLPSRSKSA